MFNSVSCTGKGNTFFLLLTIDYKISGGKNIVVVVVASGFIIEGAAESLENSCYSWNHTEVSSSEWSTDT